MKGGHGCGEDMGGRNCSPSPGMKGRKVDKRISPWGGGPRKEGILTWWRWGSSNIPWKEKFNQRAQKGKGDVGVKRPTETTGGNGTKAEEMVLQEADIMPSPAAS